VADDLEREEGVFYRQPRSFGDRLAIARDAVREIRFEDNRNWLFTQGAGIDETKISRSDHP
jgi:hypothetical protein